MHLIVGLGNPGKEYAGSRHNLGFQVIEAMAVRLKAPEPVQKHWSLVSVTEYKRKQVVLAQPLTFMNRSGRAVLELMRNLTIDLSALLVIYDDLDLPPGLIRLRRKGGSAGHRGIQSIIDQLGTNEFPRLRIGIGKAPEDLNEADYVLTRINQSDTILISNALSQAQDASLLFIEEGLEAAMNHYNRSTS
jgi:peptidyl-tRNA hydrolase, PTH1 family